MMDRMKPSHDGVKPLKVFQRIWNDPVLSKVIAAVIIGAISYAYFNLNLLPLLLGFALWVLCVCVRYWKSTTGRVIRPVADIPVFRFSRRARRWALVGIFLVPIGF